MHLIQYILLNQFIGYQESELIKKTFTKHSIQFREYQILKCNNSKN